MYNIHVKLRSRILFLFLVLLVLASPAWAIPWQEVPNPQTTSQSYVQDSAKILTAEQRNALNQISQTVEKNTSAEIAVVTVDSLEGLTIEDYAVQLFQKWGIGKKEKDNGLLLLFALKEKKIRVEVGYGLEGEITDALASRWIRNYAIPQFKAQQYHEGLLQLSQAAAAKLDPSAFQEPRLSAEAVEAEFEESITSSSVEYVPLNWQEILLKSVLPWSGFFLLAIIFFLTRQKSYRAKAQRTVYWRSLQVNGYFIAFSLFFQSLLWLGNVIAAFFAVWFMVFLIIVAKVFKAPSSAKKFRLQSFLHFRFILIFNVALFVLGIMRGYISRSLSVSEFYFPLAVGAFLIAILATMKAKSLKKYSLPCPHCQKPMRILGSIEEDKHLQAIELDEEAAEGMDYEFWTCQTCDYLERFEVVLDQKKKCPRCERLSLKQSQKTLQKATSMSAGLALVTIDCLNRVCDYLEEKQVKLPKLSSASSSSSSWSSSGSSSSSSGSFGGGSSGGGGASGSW